MTNSLEERLKTHSSAFDGLLSLIPAKYYYDDATQDQWQQKKKSKQEHRKNKRAKLDPASKDEADEYSNGKASAKDVRDNKAKTGKPVRLPGQQPKEDSEVSMDESIAFDDDLDDKSKEAEVTEKTPKEKAKQEKEEVANDEQKQRQQKLAALRERLASKIDQMKEKRKAVGSSAKGAPKSRQQILEDRKRKEELKKKRKREEEEDDEEKDESDSDSDSEDEADATDATEGTLFGNIVFNDGTRVTSDLSKIRNTVEKKKKKGPANNDIKAHLALIEKKKERLAAMSAEQQQKAADKEKWQRVMNQAEGVKVKDDEHLLKKALKRKEKQKLKSEREWKDRKQTVKDTIAARQKRREENLQARKDAKGVRGKKKKQLPRLKKFTGIVKGKGKKRAGFEGSAKSKK